MSDVLGDDDRADEVEAESLESYAERKGIQVVEPPTARDKLDNPSKQTKGKCMAAAKTPTKADLEAILDQVADKASAALDPASGRRELVEALQGIYDLAGPDDDDDDTHPFKHFEHMVAPANGQINTQTDN